MATGQDILNTMELLNQELQLQDGEADVSRALIAINRAIDFFEAELSKHPDVAGDSTGTIVTAASTEYTAFPVGLLRLDRLQLLGSDSLPLWDLEPVERTGGHRQSWKWPYFLGLGSSSTGKPQSYWTDGRRIYWDPLPDAAHTIRWYGLRAASDMTASATFPYEDVAILPVATFAVGLLNLGKGDPINDFMSLANQTFGSVITTMSRFNRDGAAQYEYRYYHNT